MNYLLDTHVVLWWLTEPKQIDLKAHKIICDKSNRLWVSCVSLWEMTIRQGIGRLTLPRNIVEVLQGEGFKILTIGPEEAIGISDLPFIHHDPFDPMLVMQAKLHDLVLITRDKIIMSYPVVTLKA